MADKEHIRILNLGHDAWNDWREREFFLAPDLSQEDLRGKGIGSCYLGNANLRGANISGEDLSKTDLHDSDLSQANLNGTNLSETHFTGANFFLATLVGANLYKADLQAADFREADLTDANLTETYLGGALLTGAVLHKTRLTGATLNATTFGDNDLSVVEGLDSVKHGGPSIIGIQTFYRSNGNIPDDFLRGSGVPENFIGYVPSLFGEAVSFYSCFISYSAKDEAPALKIYHDLQDAGVRCWISPQDLKVGESIRSTIEDAIILYDKLLLVLSSNSVRSEWVKTEVSKALEKEQATQKTVLFPIRLDDAVFETDSDWAVNLRSVRNIGDFRAWEDADAYQRAISRLVRDLRLSIVIDSENAEAGR